MATTTSLENSGLLNEILPHFEEESGIKVDVIAVGTGKALRLAENGDVDIVFVHAPEAEDEFMRQGFGIKRHKVMQNEFVIVGPKNDPGGIKGKDVRGVFTEIAQGRNYFVSRGDESGTHKKEKKIWDLIKIKPQGKWYLETGQGMAITLKIADEKRAYCLTDRATFLAVKHKIDLIILCEKDKILLNPYSIIAVNPKKYPDINYSEAILLIKWFISYDTQRIILGFKKDKEVLFYPAVYR